MTKLDTPDLCARLDQLKGLCDRLEDAQDNPESYRNLVRRIRLEAEAFQHAVCDYLHNDRTSQSAVATHT